ncbi:PQQ-binding-like beta-propeller repeat protein [Streptomyces sp. ISL-112]|uniref:outer membrane protein assembly factor BamB family protein n=1 Tax=unclassified Streptomyces TaxID=2593676 RepID=UPI001BE72614|nr:MULTISPECIES: PQQ-binding-like beta-propeller repeat protein [unclassified Streptomyces]MBT2428691.1 PQQ-binding-like beta-propeller repeat protein [Streptomyces sp. ISL-112]MBT2461107.1 PQQ-binding-like beta-propeller repeat protein [Streptomyces sp. ISL-63]
MEALRREDPRRFGRFAVLARFQEAASAVQYVARDTGTGELAVITVARPALAAVPAFRRRFQAEARTAERLAGGWVTPPLETGEDALLHTATEYVPALPLAEAIGIAGPLPERSVRILGAGIAEIISRVHAGGPVLQGLAPGTVLLAEDGPRLTAFGPLGAAAAAEARPGGQLSVRLGYLTPEQVEGKEVGTASDLFVLGLLLAYAATGTTPFTEGPPDEAARRIAEADPELDAVPEELRDLIADCLAKDPAERPTAGTVAAELALEGAAGLARGGWLPERLAAAVADQEARVRALEVPEEAEAAGPAGKREDARPTGEPEDAVPTDVVPGAAAEAAEDAPAEAPSELPVTQAPSDPRDTAATTSETPDTSTSTGTGTGTGNIGEDRGTTRFLNTGPKPPRSDRATTHLALPHKLPPGRCPAPALPTGTTPATPGLPSPAHHHTHGSPAPYPAAALPGSTGQGNGGGRGGGPMVALPLPPSPTPPEGSATSRRTLIAIAAAAVGGLVVGGGSVAAIGGGETAAATDDKPATPKPRRTLPGQPPEPRWSYSHPASESAPLTTALWRDRLLVVTSESQASAVDIRTGKRVWQRADAAKGQAAVVAGDLCFVASPTEFLWLAPKDGTVVHRVRYADGFTDLPDLQVGRLAGHSGAVIWFTGSRTVTVKAPKPKKGKKKAADKRVVQAYLFAYDIVRRTEVWRTPVPAGRAPGTPLYRVVAERSADLLVRQDAVTLTAADVKAAKGKGSIRSFDQQTGKLRWTKQYGTAGPEAAVTGDEDGILYAGAGAHLQSFEADTGKPLWRVEGTEGSAFGTPLAAGPVLHTTERSRQVGAVERESGRVVWRRSTEVPGIGSAPVLTLSSSGKTLLASDATQVTAFSAADGERLWKFQDIGAADPKGATVSAPYRTLAVGAHIVVQRDRAFYAFPVA